MSVEEKLAELFIDLPEPLTKPGAFSYIVASGKRISVAGVLPLAEGGRMYTGRVGSDIRIETAQRAARAALLQALAQLKDKTGSLDEIKRIVRLEVYVACGPDFKEHRQVADAASDMLNQLFGLAGRHCQLAVGVSSLPNGACLSLALDAESR